MKIIANKDSKNYVYYQRRLAELQARIESANDVGKHLLKNKKIMDLTASQGVWVRSVAEDTIRPPEEVWDKWLAGDTKSLKAALDEAKRRNWTVMVDSWTSTVIKSLVLDFDNSVLLPAPTKGESYFTHLNNIYLSIWNKTKGISDPIKK
jgi:DNA-binding transcriptional MerR regulator